MKTSKEIRSYAWQTLMRPPWGGRVFWALCSVSIATSLAMQAIAKILVHYNMTTWFSFLQIWFENYVGQGLLTSVPSRAIANQMTLATAFFLFFQILFLSIRTFGEQTFLLKAVRRDEDKWFASAFTGFAQPFNCLGLYLQIMIRLMFWFFLSILFLPLLFLPIIACYRYQLAWPLKADHPDWSAAQCIRESCRLMKGNKWKAFYLDCSYWRPITLVLLLLLLLVIGNTLGLATLTKFSSLALWPISIIVAFYYKLGQAEFYREISAAAESETESSLPPDTRDDARGPQILQP